MNSSSIMSPSTRMRFPEKKEISWSARLRVSVMFLQQLFCRSDGLVHSNGFNAKWRRRHKATIARARVALKWILNNRIVGRPGSPARGIRGTPERNNGCADSSSKMHRPGIVADIEPGSADQLRKVRNAEAKQDLRRRQLFRDFRHRGLLSRATRQNCAEPHTLQ